MDKIIAGQIADEKLQEYLKKDSKTIEKLLTESEHEFITRNSVEYQLRVTSMYEDKDSEKIGKVVVIVSIDDQMFWSTLAPLCRSDYYYING
jgi:hypothetical protein